MPRLENCAWSRSCAARGRHKTQLGDTAAGLAAKVGEMLSSSVSSPSLPLVGHGARSPGAAGTAGTLNLSQHLVQRSLVLFVVGAFMALVLNLLLFPSAWWGPPCCGTAAAVVGLLYPCIDSHLGEPHKFKREWASVMRCIAVFVGINHASAKLDFANNVQLSLTLAALSLGLWWTFDRSRSGLGLGITIAFVATLITQFLVYNGVYQYTSPDFLYIRSWLPCIFFSGGVTVGNIGRQLAMGIPEKPHND
ncbi:PREDICTED: insulin-induced gene 1 protein [Nipponia nippon]|uniref:insulin-induced gene 1 protein n=1 Tax=Nipponia nippon TaxID=128390 RepID=UPI000510E43E|nr:PREDICTED: insulin-induced gene 1 protein [Nipponia nippon]